MYLAGPGTKIGADGRGPKAKKMRTKESGGRARIGRDDDASRLLHGVKTKPGGT